MKHYEAADVPQKADVVKKLCRGDAVGGEHMEGVLGLKLSTEHSSFTEKSAYKHLHLLLALLKVPTIYKY